MCWEAQFYVSKTHIYIHISWKEHSMNIRDNVEAITLKHTFYVKHYGERAHGKLVWLHESASWIGRENAKTLLLNEIFSSIRWPTLASLITYLFSVKMHIYPNLKPNLNIIDLSFYKETRVGHFNMSLQNAEQVNWFNGWESFSSLHTYYKPPLPQ